MTAAERDVIAAVKEDQRRRMKYGFPCWACGCWWGDIEYHEPMCVVRKLLLSSKRTRKPAPRKERTR